MPENSESAIVAEDLVKVYRSRRARGRVRVDGLSFTVPEGRVFGLLGPNGAGKSTTTKILTTLSAPTSGTARVAGHDVRRAADAVRASIGYVSQGSSTDPVLTARENLEIAARLRGARPADARARAARLLEDFGLGDASRRPVSTFSGGMRRRLDVAAALVHRPTVLFLDEPTTGLDPEARAVMWAEIRRLSGEEALTVVLTTHYMEEADRLADELLIVNSGRAVVQGTPDELKTALHGDSRPGLARRARPGRRARRGRRTRGPPRRRGRGIRSRRHARRPHRRRVGGRRLGHRRAGCRGHPLRAGRGIPPHPRRCVPALRRPHLRRRRDRRLADSRQEQQHDRHSTHPHLDPARSRRLVHPDRPGAAPLADLDPGDRSWGPVMSLVQPVIWILLFGAVFSSLGALPQFGGEGYIDYLVPGILMMTVLYSGAWAGTGYIDDINSGVMDQYLTSPLSRTAIISGQLAQQLIVNVAQSLVVLGIGWLAGARYPGRHRRDAGRRSASRRSSRRSSAARRRPSR